MNERVKELRKVLELSGEKFGERIGVGKTAISLIESGRNNLTEQNIISICREFKVNEDWLRYGTGEMFKENSLDEEIISFIGDIQWDAEDNFKKRFISAIAKLNDSEWEVIEKIMKNMVIEEKKD